MAHSLTDLQIARLVGAQSFTRGKRFADNGHVGRPTWATSGTRVFAKVQGSGENSYLASVAFQHGSRGTLVGPVGSCTCEVGINCKHVAALLIVTRGEASDEQGEDPPGEAASKPGSGGSTSRVRFVADADAPAAPALPLVRRGPSWQRALDSLTSRGGIATGNPLGLQLELIAPTRNWRAPADPFAPPRLGARPVTLGQRGKWIKGNLSWSTLNQSGGYDRAQHASLSAIRELHLAGRDHYSFAEEWIYLEAIASPTLWHLLTRAREAGVAILTSDSTQSAVTIAEGPAELALDLSRSGDGLALKPSFTLDGTVLDPRQLILLGNPAHGVASWTVPEASDSGVESRSASSTRAWSQNSSSSARGSSPAATEMPSSILLTLAVLSAPISPAIRDLAAAENPLFIPAADEPLFRANYYPFLREQLTLSSSDGSVELAAAPRPHLSLSIASKPGASVDLDWQWRYSSPDAGTAHPLYAAPGETSYRDQTREREILGSLGGLLERYPQLAAGADNGPSRLAETSTLSGARMIQFLANEVPLLHASDAVSVSFTEALPDYREAEEAPLITLATQEREGERDWFDLDVDIKVDGQKIHLDELITALATDQELMILPDGVWFGLDKPELQQLRRLIEEARALQDSTSHGLGISRFQSDLWEELQELGVVTAQAEAWRTAVASLASDVQIVTRPLPETVHATLRGYQQEGFDWLSFLYDQGLGGVLADDMGLGKTLQAIALIAHTRAVEPEGPGASDASPAIKPPFLVVAPTSVVPNWASECAKFAPSLNVVTITATSGKRTAGLAKLIAGADVVITSYTLFRLDFEEYERNEWAGLLLDEAQFVKNHQSRAHQAARRLNAPFKLAITGTPLENNLMELWSLFSITAPGLFPSPRKFAEFYQRAIERDGDEDRLVQLRRRIRPFMLRRTKDQVATDLPAKQEQVLELELHPKHRKVYQTHLQRERQKVLGLIEDMNSNRFEIFRSLTMLRQLSLDASLYDEKYADIPSTKLDALLEMLDDTVAEGHRTLIFSQFTGYLAKARERLDAAGIAYSYLDGKTRNRAAAIEQFKNGDNPVFLISLKAGGFGLNLTEADYVILLDPWWNPATEAQAVDRTHRIGQTKNVMVYRLVSKDTIEEKVMALKVSKSQLFDSVMTDGAASGAALSAADIRSLLE